ncbi:MAG: UPF0149 family protein [Rhizobiales bacterium]|nr:UPF0149 family protein [Rhizobacter sp.]
MTPKETPPSTGAPAHDLTDAEFAELDDLLLETPEPLEPLDVVMLDGYLCGVIVQPVLLAPATWLAHIFDFDGRPLPDEANPEWLARTTALIMRRHAALNRAIVEDGWFEPLVLEFDDEHPHEPVPEGEVDHMASSDGPVTRSASSPEESSVASGRPGSDLSPVSQSLMPWVAGFHHAAETFPDLAEMPDDAVMAALARLYRHLPVEDDEQRELVALLDREHPLATLDDAMEELVVTIADLQDLTAEQRYKVETVKRETPKVGRNDACPCGSGKKFKQCHG